MEHIVIIGIVFLVWVISLPFMIPKINSTRFNKKSRFDLAQAFGYEKVRMEAESAGWSLNAREFVQIVLVSIAVGIIIALAIGNFFFIALGVIFSFTLPRAIIIHIKKRRRLNILFELPDNMKQLTSRLVDFPSVQKALFAALPDMQGDTKTYFERALRSLEIGMTVERTLIDLANTIRLKKFNDFVEKLLMAHQEGYHERSINSLKETIRAIGEDITMIKSLEIKSKGEIKTLRTMILASWAMPVLLSFMNSENGNVFLTTIQGQIFIVSFVGVTVFSFFKGREYLSLNLDEL